MAGIDINRTTSGVLLPPELSAEIWQSTLEASVVQRLVPQVSLPGSGVTIQTITGDPAAEWVAETGVKPVDESTFGSKNMTPYKMAVIEPFSDEFRRDKAALYGALASRLPNALARLFDATVLHGTAPGSGFDTLANAAEVSIAADPYDGFVDALQAVANAGGNLSGWALNTNGEVALLRARDGFDRPFFTANPQTDGSIGSVLGRPVFRSQAVSDPSDADLVGIAGDFASARWGTVEGIKISVTDQATLGTGENAINLWQRNMFAVRVEAEFGFIVRDGARFVRLTSAAAGTGEE